MKVRIIAMLVVAIFGTAKAVNDHQYIVNAIKKQSNITQADVDAWKSSDVVSKIKELVARSTYGRTVAGLGVLAQSALIAKVVTAKNPTSFGYAASRILLAELAAGSAYALYRYSTVSPQVVMEKIKKYVALCQTMILANKKYDKADDVLLALVEHHNSAWIGKSYIAIYNGLQSLIVQGGYALELLVQMQAYEEDKEMLHQLEKKVAEYIVHCTQNQRAITAEYRSELKEYKKSEAEATDLYAQKLDILANQWKLLTSVSKTGMKIAGGAASLYVTKRGITSWLSYISGFSGVEKVKKK